MEDMNIIRETRQEVWLMAWCSARESKDYYPDSTLEDSPTKYADLCLKDFDERFCKDINTSEL